MVKEMQHTINELRQINDHTWSADCSCGEFQSGPRSKPYEAIGAVNKHIKKSSTWGERLWGIVMKD